MIFPVISLCLVTCILFIIARKYVKETHGFLVQDPVKKIFGPFLIAFDGIATGCKTDFFFNLKNRNEYHIANRSISDIGKCHHDVLTVQPNQSEFVSRLQSSIEKKHITKAAVLFLDLDQFKLVHESVDHHVRSLWLKHVTARLLDCIQPENFIIQQGGDEFIFFLPDQDQEGATATAEYVLERIQAPYLINDVEMYITPSIGISLYPEDGEKAETPIKKAELALQQAMQVGNHRIQFYMNQLWKQSYDRLETDRDLRKALEREEFVLYFQPKLNIRSGEIMGLEALIRWPHPQKGCIPPGEFIPLTEETGLIIQLGEWVLRNACLQNKVLQECGFPPITMSVNVSVRQFFQPNFVEMIGEILEDTRLSPEYLELEITESVMTDSQLAIEIVKDLKKIGVKISLDDFGTGYSSLHYLKRFPIDKLKIDQSFVRDCLSDENDATIVKTIIFMAHQLNLEVIAEGVETNDQLIFLQQHSCDEIQGYLLSRPLPVEELTKVFYDIQQFVSQIGIPKEVRDQNWMQEALMMAQKELQETIRLQEGMTFKFKKQDERFIFTLCDGKLLYRMGLVPEQVVGRDLYDIHPKEVADELSESFQRAWNGEQNVSIERERNGVYYLAFLRPVQKGGRVVEVIASCVEITERKRIEDALKMSESKFRLIAENMSDLIVVMDLEGELQYLSPSYEKLLSYSLKDLEGSTVFDLIHPDDLPVVQEYFRDIEPFKILPPVEFRKKHAQGHWIHVEAKGTPVIGEEGKAECFILVSRDISGRKRAEELLRKSERLAVVAELAAGVAHEIRNPLTSIKGFVQLLKLGVVKPEYFDIMLDEFQRLEEIIHEFLTFAKPHKVQCKPSQLVKVIENVMVLIDTHAIQHNIQIKYEFERDIPLIWCDENQIKQVLMNLLTNAVDSMPNGGEIYVQVKRLNENQVGIRIIDQGCGIPEGRLKRLGEPFYSTKEKGTGLGLMVSLRILEEHQGIIHFESEVDKGTTVEVILPVNSEER